MAQSGYTPISLYYSSTTTNVPTNTNLANGELAINITDGKLFYKDNTGTVQVIASKAGNVNVSSFSGGTTGLTPNTATTGAVTLAGTLAIANGGTGQTTASSAFNALSPVTTTGDLIIGNGTNSATRLAIGTNGYVLTSNGTTASWQASTGGVTSFQTSLNGLTPSTSTTGAVTLAGTLGVSSGGTGLTSFTSNGIPYATSTSALTTNTGLTYNGSSFSVTGSGTFASASATGQLFINANGGSYSASMNVGGTGNGLGYTSGELYFQNTNNAIIFANKASANESVRIASTGAIGLSGANYGTTGQVLTSNGSASAPTWQTVSGGATKAQAIAYAMTLGF
jgi:hypothetical protein